MKHARRLSLAAAALWWGSLSTIGFVVVPLLFRHLPQPALAGATAAHLFSAQTALSIGCGLLLLLLGRKPAQARLQLPPLQRILPFVLLGLLTALLGEFGAAPRIMQRENLALWHAVGSALYLVQWLSASVVLWRLSGPEPA